MHKTNAMINVDAIAEPYDTRRDVLERTVRSIHGFSQLAKRSRVDLKLPSREAEHVRSSSGSSKKNRLTISSRP